MEETASEALLQKEQEPHSRMRSVRPTHYFPTLVLLSHAQWFLHDKNGYGTFEREIDSDATFGMKDSNAPHPLL